MHASVVLLLGLALTADNSAVPGQLPQAEMSVVSGDHRESYEPIPSTIVALDEDLGFCQPPRDDCGTCEGYIPRWCWLPLRSTGNMPPHVEYLPYNHGSLCFHPYNEMHVPAPAPPAEATLLPRGPGTIRSERRLGSGGQTELQERRKHATPVMLPTQQDARHGQQSERSSGDSAQATQRPTVGRLIPRRKRDADPNAGATASTMPRAAGRNTTIRRGTTTGRTTDLWTITKSAVGGLYDGSVERGPGADRVATASNDSSVDPVLAGRAINADPNAGATASTMPRAAGRNTTIRRGTTTGRTTDLWTITKSAVGGLYDGSVERGPGADRVATASNDSSVDPVLAGRAIHTGRPVSQPLGQVAQPAALAKITDEDAGVLTVAHLRAEVDARNNADVNDKADLRDDTDVRDNADKSLNDETSPNGYPRPMVRTRIIEARPLANRPSAVDYSPADDSAETEDAVEIEDTAETTAEVSPELRRVSRPGIPTVKIAERMVRQPVVRPATPQSVSDASPEAGGSSPPERTYTTRTDTGQTPVSQSPAVRTPTVRNPAAAAVRQQAPRSEKPFGRNYREAGRFTTRQDDSSRNRAQVRTGSIDRSGQQLQTVRSTPSRIADQLRETLAKAIRRIDGTSQPSPRNAPTEIPEEASHIAQRDTSDASHVDDAIRNPPLVEAGTNVADANDSGAGPDSTDRPDALSQAPEVAAQDPTPRQHAPLSLSGDESATAADVPRTESEESLVDISRSARPTVVASPRPRSPLHPLADTTPIRKPLTSAAQPDALGPATMEPIGASNMAGLSREGGAPPATRSTSSGSRRISGARQLAETREEQPTVHPQRGYVPENHRHVAVTRLRRGSLSTPPQSAMGPAVSQVEQQPHRVAEARQLGDRPPQDTDPRLVQSSRAPATKPMTADLHGVGQAWRTAAPANVSVEEATVKAPAPEPVRERVNVARRP